MKLTTPVIIGIVVAIGLAYVLYNEWRKKRIAEEKAALMAEIANTNYSPLGDTVTDPITGQPPIQAGSIITDAPRGMAPSSAGLSQFQ